LGQKKALEQVVAVLKTRKKKATSSLKERKPLLGEKELFLLVAVFVHLCGGLPTQPAGSP
jgi:hypothetical protein